LLTALGTVLGVGALVAVLGLTATASGQISERFTVLAATEVTVEQTENAAREYTGGSEPYMAFPADASARIEELNGARHAGVSWPVEVLPELGPQRGVSALPPGSSRAAATDDIAVYAAEPGVLAVINPRYSLGRGYDEFHEQRAEHVAIIGASVARQLGINRLDGDPAIFINEQPFTVIGIVADVDRNTEFLLGVLVPARSAEQLWGLPAKATPTMVIETDIGAAQLVASQAALALRPDNPGLFRVIAPPDPSTLRENVATDLNTLFLVLAGVSLLIGTFGIANTTLVAVLERVPEIGLRRSLGARPRHIAVQFLAESAVLGTVGGIVGTTLGITTILAVALMQDWSAIMPSWLPASFGLGTLTGLLAGLYPAWQATRIEPADALRR
jgi:putative ABC transport system permease protein